MTAVAKTKVAQYGLVIAGLGFLTGGMLMCYCPGWFVCSGAASILPIIFGSRLMRLAGTLLCVASFAMAVNHFQDQQAQTAKLKAVHERLRDNQR